jgi:beta-fructofuranosidase
MKAVMTASGKVTKVAQPLIPSPPPGYTMNFRDPQVCRYAGGYRLLIGAQTTSGEGIILVYKSTDLETWDFSGELHFSDCRLGYMVECPNLVFVEDRPVLIFCPQGLDRAMSPYDNIYPNKALVGAYYDEGANVIQGGGLLQNFDEGFEFYAAQAINAPDGRVLTIGWIGLPDVETPTAHEGWAHCLSLVRELSLVNGRLCQYPVKETETLRGQRYAFTALGKGNSAMVRLPHDCYELEVTLPPSTKGEFSLAGLLVMVDTAKGEIIVDRSRVAGTHAHLQDTSRAIKVEKTGTIVLNIFIDVSVFEIFVNHGEQAFSGRFFPTDVEGTITWAGTREMRGTIWEISAEGKLEYPTPLPQARPLQIN